MKSYSILKATTKIPTYLNIMLSASTDGRICIPNWLVVPIVTIIVLISLFLVLRVRNVALGKELQMQKTFYEQILQNTKSMTIVWNTDLTFVEFNDYIRQVVDTTHHILDISIVEKIFHNINNDGGNLGDSLAARALENEGNLFIFRTKNKKQMYVMFNSVVLKDEKGIKYILSVGTDVTKNTELKQELMEMNHNLTVSEERYNLAMESAEIGIAVLEIGMEDDIYLSDKARRIFGVKASKKVDSDFLKTRIHSDDIDEFSFEYNRLAIGLIDSFVLESRVKTMDENYRYFMLKFKNTVNKSGDVIRIIGAFIDVTTQKDVHKIIDRTTFEDELTGLANRRKFLLEGENILRNAKKNGNNLALIILDVDRFQRVNNLSGYEAGNKLLVEVANSIANAIDKTTFLSRLSGDDFALIYEYDHINQVEDLLNKISVAVGNIRLSLLIKEKVEIKGGVSILDDKTTNVISMLDEASMALMVAKSSPNIRFQHFDEDIQRIMLEREILEEELNKAYHNKEFILFYQPKIDMKTKTLKGIEALMRWNHPEKGIVPPGLFIPVAEEIGLITKIDEWGMREACRQNKKWQDAGIAPIKMSVNVSQAQFYETDIVSTIKDILDDTGLEAKWLDIELTETMAMKDIDKTIKILNEIRDLGCSISMDDFGSGYSSLSSLKIIPIDILKIDRSLVIDVETDDASKHITAAIVSLAKSMNVTVLAEGIETEGQLDFLTGLNVDLAQGYLFGRPRPEDEFVRFFEQYKIVG